MPLDAAEINGTCKLPRALGHLQALGVGVFRQHKVTLVVVLLLLPSRRRRLLAALFQARHAKVVATRAGVHRLCVTRGDRRRLLVVVVVLADIAHGVSALAVSLNGHGKARGGRAPTLVDQVEVEAQHAFGRSRRRRRRYQRHCGMALDLVAVGNAAKGVAKVKVARASDALI